ncbi:ABC transporter substrate-binding protein [Microbacterium betulae]|uniref:ABC transporter substrate-binding protein n=1 Tax=Microbacterium betulae TaxID=2981139 RepID=A0AA97FIU7_9MICO|nr:ABC transporter substrate-binding protein [Microbacterium sp. AB]WOF22824.1 ABC transporter substrate-binding protein [Microbacterium sp. AB]
MRRRARARAVGALLTGLLALAACASPSAGGGEDAAAIAETRPALSELDVLDDPRSYVGESTATLSDAAITPVEEEPDQSLPATVTSYDQAGETEVEVVDTSRVVAVDLAGSVAATVWGLGFGDTLVGRDQSTTFPGTEELETVTSGGHTINAEAVIALAPTLVITDGTVGPADVVAQLRDVGIAVVFVENEASFEGAAELARQVAAVYGAPEAGELLAERIAQEVDDTIAEIAGIAPSAQEDRLRIVFLYLRGSAGVYYLFGSESGADQLIEGLGGVDVVSELGWEGMQPMTDEALVAADPDLILVMTKGIESLDGIDGLLAEKPAVALTTAGENRRFVDMDDGTVLSFGPRSALILDALARAVYAPEAGSE